MTVTLRHLSAELLGDVPPARPADATVLERLLAEVRALRRDVAALRDEVQRAAAGSELLKGVVGAVEADVSRLAAPLAAFQQRLATLDEAAAESAQRSGK